MKVILEKTARTSSMWLTKVDAIGLIISIMGLVLGRAAVLGFLNPIAIAFLASFITRGYKLYTVSVFTFIGLATRFGGLYLIKYMLAVAIIVLISIVLDKLNKKATRVVQAGIAAAAIIVPSTLIVGFLGNASYYVSMTIVEATLAFTLVFLLQDGIKVLEGKITRLNNEAMLSTAILFGSVVAGMADIHIGMFSLKTFVCVLLVLIMANKGKAHIGATTAILLGLVLSISSDVSSSFIIVLSSAGMLAGVGKSTLWQIVGFVIGGAIVASYLEPSLLDMSMAVSTGVGALVFAFAPKNITLENEAIDNEYITKTKDYLNYRLMNFSNSFDKLSATFSSIAEKRHTLDQHDISKVIDDVANKTCVGCSKRQECWGGEFYSTYQMLFSLLGTCEKKGAVQEIPDHMNDFCIQKEKMLTNINRIFELHRNNIQWENKIAESRELVSQQLKGVGDILGNISNELNQDLRFIPELEENILKELNKNKIGVDSVIVIENRENKCEVTLSCRNQRKGMANLITSIISDVVGKKMILEDDRISRGVLRLIEKQNFSISSGIAGVTKENGKVSGDSFSAMHIKGEKCLLMLSDGMGSGDKAREESKATVGIFEDFLETGFDKETAIKMINSVLVLKSNEDSFSTLDICVLDMYTGISEFVKMGASSTYIIRDGMVQVVRNTSLPMGILNDVQVDITTKRLRHGDIIVMVTDGVTEGESGNDKEDYLINLLSNNRLSDPQDLAEDILEQAKENSGEILDDMTVMVAKIVGR